VSVAGSKRVVRVAIYIRISRDDAELKGLGVDRQLDIVRASLPRFGGIDEDWVEVLVLDENNTSATNGKVRPELTRGLDLIRSGAIDAIACFTQDRLLRMPIELEHIIHMHEFVTPVKLATSGGGVINLDDPDSVMAARNTAASSAREAKLISIRRKAEVEQFAARGRRHAQAPFGWSRVHDYAPNGRLIGSHDVINEAEATVLRYAAKRVLGGVSMRSVVAELAAGDVHPRSRQLENGTASSRTWSSTQLRGYLTRPANAGLRVHHKEVLDGVIADWPALWDLATHQRLVNMMNDPERKKYTRGSRERWLLSGIAVCGHCENGGLIRVNTSIHGASRYVCVGTSANPGCYQAHRVEDIDAHIGRIVEVMLADPSASAPADEATEQLAPLYRRLDELAADQHEWDTADGIKPAQLTARTRIIDAERAEVQAAISALLPSLNVTLDLPNGWRADLPIATRKAVIRNLFESVTLNPPAERGKGRRFQLEDVTVVTRRQAAAMR
jgi:site-specific DNA recombinase